MPGSCPHCGCDGTPPLWDRFVRFLGEEIDRVRSPRVPAVGTLTFAFVRFEDTMAKVAIYRVGIAPTTDKNNVGYLLSLSEDGAQRDDIPVVDGLEVSLKPGALITAALIPVGPKGPDPSKISETIQFVSESVPPDEELEKAPAPTLEFLRFEDATAPTV